MPGLVPTHITVDLPIQSEGVLPVANGPLATNDLPGFVQPDGSTIVIDPITGIISATAGSLLPPNIQTVSYLALPADILIQMNAGGATTVTLPIAGVTTGKFYFVKNVGAGTCSVAAASGNIDADASIPLTQWQAVQIYWDGSAWHQLSQSLSP